MTIVEESKLLSDSALETRKAELQERQAALCVQRDALNEQIIALYDQLAALEAESVERVMRSSPGPDWAWLLFEDGASHRHKVREQALAALGLSASGYYPELDQAAVRITLYKDKPGQTEAVCSALRQVLPALKPHTDGHRRIGIFEHSLSEHGIWSLHITPEDVPELHFTRYSRSRCEKTFASLEAAIEYIAQHHYYERWSVQHGRPMGYDETDD